MSFFKKSFDVRVAVDTELNTYLVIDSEKVDRVSVLAPNGDMFEGNRSVKICKKPKENCPSGTYKIKTVKNGKENNFDLLLKGPDIKVTNIVPQWNRYQGISAFYVLTGVEYSIENHGDLPLFLRDKEFSLPTGKLQTPEFLILPGEAKKMKCTSQSCDRAALKETEEYEEEIRAIAQKIERWAEPDSNWRPLPCKGSVMTD